MPDDAEAATSAERVGRGSGGRCGNAQRPTPDAVSDGWSEAAHVAVDVVEEARPVVEGRFEPAAGA
jgi:hypothetical protein